MSDIFDISAATVEDLPAIMALEEQGFDHARWSADAWRSEIAAADRRVVVCRMPDGRINGVVTFRLSDDVADLNRVIVAPGARRLRLGTLLVADGMEWARREGADRVLLEVEHDNDPALALYQALEFNEIARRRDYYGAGRDAIVMERSLL